ncbi:hypothetical protein FB550_108206 [Neobacillus bataviensis]|uniref:Phr family secreted Rap phosphatase inhibitor n=1 Tax=Neobacillus bataviensis TaxID=220685 RepID=A0A561D675_9BACI|nr:hypothetical protein [Neobacillus bataviensis]TWD98949.1 hypothetical protein FB550_108206 [Neobacillus bataviensis]
MKKMVLLLSVSFLVLFATNTAVKSEHVSNTHNYAYVGPQGPPILPPV